MSDASTPISLQPLGRPKLSVIAAERLLEEIRRRKLQPGTRVPSERELMGMLGIGRSSVREALNGLAMLGAIEIRHGQGAFVAQRVETTADKIAAALANGIGGALLEARLLVETEIAALAATRATAADLEEMERVLAQHERALQDGTLAAAHSAAFHYELAEASHSEVLASFVGSIIELLVERGPELEQRSGYREWELTEHRQLLEAVRGRDPEVARSRMLGHLKQVESLHEQLDESGVSTSTALVPDPG